MRRPNLTLRSAKTCTKNMEAEKIKPKTEKVRSQVPLPEPTGNHHGIASRTPQNPWQK